ncbi:hypothetical protein UT300003_25530 [Clostridium sardiniense]|uniref:hypothetical protein n=1 Tax=Clostridium sardiniense TaxID=29369 RepID=UPI0019566304|nr:hypothetical protein [Clostridium sardiniense]MBM7833281.1 hypothetical protein [Clostridium sardiniense]
MSWYLIVVVFVVMLGALTLAYQVYKMTELDAVSRGLKHPKFWGIFSLSGDGCGGLLLYLIGRRKYTSSMSEADKLAMESRKKKAGVSLAFLALSTITLFTICILTF